MTNTEGAGRPPRIARTSRQPPAPRPEQRATSNTAGLTGGDLDAVDQELTDADYGSPAGRARAENCAARLADQALIEELRANGFTGPAAEVLRTELAAYGIAVLMGWMRTGAIFARCKAAGRPLPAGDPQWTADDRHEIALEATAQGLRYFTDRVLLPGKFDARRGATLRTYFIGACLLQFPNVFSAWIGEQRRWASVTDETPLDDGIGGTDPQWADPTGDAAVRRCVIRAWLASITDPATRYIAYLVIAHKVSHHEAGQAVGLTARGVEGRLFRLRRPQ